MRRPPEGPTPEAGVTRPCGLITPAVGEVTHLTNGPSQAVCRRIGMEHRGVTHLWYDEPSEHFVVSRGAWSSPTS